MSRIPVNVETSANPPRADRLRDRTLRHIRQYPPWLPFFAGLYAISIAMRLAAGWKGSLPELLVLAGPLAWLSAEDIRSRTLPDAATAILAVCGICVCIRNAPETLWSALLGAAAVFVLFWAVGEAWFHLSGTEGFGIGDAKLLAASAFWVGSSLIWVVLGLACIGGIALALVSREIRQSGVPFGPFLAYALFLTYPPMPFPD